MLTAGWLEDFQKPYSHPFLLFVIAAQRLSPSASNTGARLQDRFVFYCYRKLHRLDQSSFFSRR